MFHIIPCLTGLFLLRNGSGSCLEAEGSTSHLPRVIFSELAARVCVFLFSVEDTEGMSIFKKKEYSAERSAIRMARGLAVMGALHFIIPEPFLSLIHI